MNKILSKNPNDLTEEDKKILKDYVQQFEPLYNRLDSIRKSIDDIINNKSKPSVIDEAYARLKISLKSLRDKLVRVLLEVSID